MKHVVPFLLLSSALHGDPRSSHNYALTPEACLAGGGRTASANYTLDVAIGSPGGTTTATPYLGKSGYAGQLYDPTGLVVTSAVSNVPEASSVQLTARHSLDDTTLLAIDQATVEWSVVSGPIAKITSDGSAIAGVVYADTLATVGAARAGFSDSFDLSVLDSIADNFGLYASDGLGDAWQVRYFGIDNPLAKPLLDPDGDTCNNQLEEVAGLVPTDSTSRFSCWLERVPGEIGQMSIIFSPRLDGRTYTVMGSRELALGAFAPLTGAITSDNGAARTVTDTDAGGPSKFYRIKIESD